MKLIESLPLSELTKQNIFVKLFGFLKVPMIFWVGPKVLELSDQMCEIKIPFNRRTKNHLNSMYFGVLCTGADLAGGLVAMEEIRKSKKNVALSFKDFKANFLKRAHGDVHFRCTQAKEVAAFVEKVVASTERHNMTVLVDAFVPSSGDSAPVATFELTLSLKKK